MYDKSTKSVSRNVSLTIAGEWETPDELFREIVPQRRSFCPHTCIICNSHISATGFSKKCAGSVIFLKVKCVICRCLPLYPH